MLELFVGLGRTRQAKRGAAAKSFANAKFERCVCLSKTCVKKACKNRAF
jgi:hypothetical protein